MAPGNHLSICVVSVEVELVRGKTYGMIPGRLRSACTSTLSDQSSLGALWIAKFPWAADFDPTADESL